MTTRKSTKKTSNTNASSKGTSPYCFPRIKGSLQELPKQFQKVYLLIDPPYVKGKEADLEPFKVIEAIVYSFDVFGQLILSADGVAYSGDLGTVFPHNATGKKAAEEEAKHYVECRGIEKLLSSYAQAFAVKVASHKATSTAEHFGDLSAKQQKDVALVVGLDPKLWFKGLDSEGRDALLVKASKKWRTAAKTKAEASSMRRKALPIVKEVHERFGDEIPNYDDLMAFRSHEDKELQTSVDRKPYVHPLKALINKAIDKSFPPKEESSEKSEGKSNGSEPDLSKRKKRPVKKTTEKAKAPRVVALQDKIALGTKRFAVTGILKGQAHYKKDDKVMTVPVSKLSFKAKVKNSKKLVWYIAA